MTYRVIQKLGWLIVVLLLLAVPALVLAGGWAVVTLDELPTKVVAQEPVTISFAVRQHGLHLAGGLSPTVTAVHAETGESITVAAEAEEEDGYYVADLTFPVAGTWRWSIDAFGGQHPMPDLQVQVPESVPVTGASVDRWLSGVLLTWPFVVGVAGSLVAVVALFAWLRRRTRWALALFLGAAIVGSLGLVVQWDQSSTAVAQASTVTAATDVAEKMGQDLFVAKGCVACHRHEAVGSIGGVGPNLTAYVANPAFLRLWLKDPADVKPKTQMPDLELSQEEIGALIAFLSVDDK